MDAWKVPAFRRWLGANTVNEVGSIASQSVLPVLIYERTHEPIAVAALGVVAVAPYLLIGLHAGGLADRFDRRRILVGALTAQGMVAAGLAIGLGTLGAQPLLVIGCELLSAMIFVFADAASFGLLPHLVPASTLGGAWGLVNATTSTAAILVPPVAIGLTATVGGPPVVAADAVSYLAAAFLLARASPIMRRRPNADPSSGGIARGCGSSADIRRSGPWWRPGSSTAWRSVAWPDCWLSTPSATSVYPPTAPVSERSLPSSALVGWSPVSCSGGSLHRIEFGSSRSPPRQPPQP
jgi:MFS family permease